MNEKEKAEAYDELRECLRFPNAPNELILGWIHAINTGNQDKKQRLDDIRDWHYQISWKFGLLEDEAHIDKWDMKALEKILDREIRPLESTARKEEN